MSARRPNAPSNIPDWRRDRSSARFILGLIAALLVALGVRVPVGAEAHQKADILYGSAPGTGGVRLDGASIGGRVYVFARVPDRPVVDGAEFVLDGTTVQRDSKAPFDLVTDAAGTALPFDTTTLANGSHRLEMRLLRKGQIQSSTTAVFDVGNAGGAGGGTTTTTTAPATTTVPPTTTTAPTTTTTMPTGVTTYSAPASIPADCSQDVTGPLNNWIASLPNGTSTTKTLLTFAAGGCYRIEDKLVVGDRTHWVIDGNGATFKATTPGHGDRKQWQVYGGRDVTLRNMTVMGVNVNGNDGAYNTALEWQHNFNFWGTQGGVVENVVGRYPWGDFVSVEPDYRQCCGVNIPMPRDIVVRNSDFSTNGRYGVTVNAGERITVENNTFDRLRWSVIDLEVEDASWCICDVKIRNNTVGTVMHALVISEGWVGSVRNIAITGNVETKKPLTNGAHINITGRADSPRTGILIEGNKLFTFSETVRLTDVNGAMVRNNTMLSYVYDATGVTLGAAANVSITGNTLDSADGVGNYARVTDVISPSSPLTVCGNTVHGRTQQPVAC